MAWRRRVDSTHTEIGQTLQRCGWQILDVHTMPGFCDYVAWKHEQPESVRLIECKPPAGAKVTKAQKDLKLRGCPIVTLTTVEDAARLR